MRREYQKGDPVPEWKKQYIRVNYSSQTAQDMAKELKISDSKVYSFLKELGVKAKPSEWYKNNRTSETVIKRAKSVVRVYSSKEPAKKTKRPPANYSNTNYTSQYE